MGARLLLGCGYSVRVLLVVGEKTLRNVEVRMYGNPWQGLQITAGRGFCGWRRGKDRAVWWSGRWMSRRGLLRSNDIWDVCDAAMTGIALRHICPKVRRCLGDFDTFQVSTLEYCSEQFQCHNSTIYSTKRREAVGELKVLWCTLVYHVIWSLIKDSISHNRGASIVTIS